MGVVEKSPPIQPTKHTVPPHAPAGSRRVMPACTLIQIHDIVDSHPSEPPCALPTVPSHSPDTAANAHRPHAE
jgi:hypothetical protein